MDMRPKTTFKTRAPRTARLLISLVIGVVFTACGGAAPGGASGSAGSLAPAPRPPSAAVATPSPAPSTAPAPIVFPSPVVLAVRPMEPALTKRWRSAGPALARAWTSTPAVAPDGRIWAASSFDDTFWIFEPDGTYIESWGTSGSADGEFTFSAEGNGFGAIAFLPDGGFYVADSGNARVQQFDPDRRFVRAFGSFGTGQGQFVTPIDIELDPAGNVYVYSPGRYDVQVFGPDGTFLRIGATSVGPYAAVDPSGAIYAVNNSAQEGGREVPFLYRFLPDGTIDVAVDLSPMLSFATGLVVLSNGDLLIASSTSGASSFAYEALIQLAPDGTIVHAWPDGAEGLAVDATGKTVYASYSALDPSIVALELP